MEKKNSDEKLQQIFPRYDCSSYCERTYICRNDKSTYIQTLPGKYIFLLLLSFFFSYFFFFYTTFQPPLRRADQLLCTVTIGET